MNEKYKMAFSEISEIFRLISDELKSKVPQKFLKMIEEEKNVSYKPKFDANVPLEEQNLMEETISILAMLKLKCWCTEEEKKKFINMLSENERKYEAELNEKYNLDLLFNKREKYIKEKEEQKEFVAMVKYKENIFAKFIKKLKKWIYQHRN